MLSRLLLRAVDQRRTSSVSQRMRVRRFEQFERAAGALDRPLNILDLGGTTDYWDYRGWADRDDVTITLLNLEPSEQRFENVVPTVGDACDLSDYDDASVDLIFSNSMIEHLFTAARQATMAAEVRRVARAYWIQTPNYWFPVEPHFLRIGWQWRPVEMRVRALQRGPVGQIGHCPEPDVALHHVREVRLMRRSDLAQVFPGATLIPERVGPLVKSWTAVSGMPVG
jgi:hypothetical protein